MAHFPPGRKGPATSNDTPETDARRVGLPDAARSLSGLGPRVAPQRVIGRNLDEHDAQAVRVLDPHFGQPPGLHRGLAQDTNAGRSQPLVLGTNVPHLKPDHHRTSERSSAAAGDLEQSRAEEEHHPRILGRAELPVHRQAQYVAVETTAPARVGRPQQDPAAQNLHTAILAAAVPKSPDQYGLAGATACGPARLPSMKTEDPYDLQRFVSAQDTGGTYDRAVAELRAGRKTSHWMWFVFPQIAGLGISPTSRTYAITSLDEARAYLAHPVLGPRLTECAAILAGLPGRSAEQIFGHLDAQKLCSSITLFMLAAPGEPVFRQILDQYFGGIPDPATEQRI